MEHLLVELVGDLQELEVVEIGGKVKRVLLPTAVRPAHQVLCVQERLEETGTHHVTCKSGKSRVKLVS